MKNKKVSGVWSRTPWPCGLIRHVLDLEVASSNPAAINSFEACGLDIKLITLSAERRKHIGFDRRWKQDLNKTTSSVCSCCVILIVVEFKKYRL